MASDEAISSGSTVFQNGINPGSAGQLDNNREIRINKYS